MCKEVNRLHMKGVVKVGCMSMLKGTYIMSHLRSDPELTTFGQRCWTVEKLASFRETQWPSYHLAQYAFRDFK
jgi:hypothetical protein